MSIERHQSASVAAVLLLAIGTSRASVTEAWVAQYPGLGAAWVVTDGAGSIYVAGTSPIDAEHDFRSDIVLLKYDVAGTLVWAREFDETDDGTHGTDEASYAALDPGGNVLVTGSSFINGTGTDMITLKYDPDGNLLWKARSPAGLAAVRVAVDGAGNVYVTGPSSSTPSLRNYVTVKYDADGNELWVRTYNGPNNFDDEPLSLAVTAEGEVAVTGTSTGGATSFDIATVRYDTNGDELWVRRYNGVSYADKGNDVIFGPGGEVYIAGHTYSPAALTDAILIKYDADGNEAWNRIHDGGAGSDTFRRLRLDSQGNVVVSGYHQNPGVTFVTAKYDPDGNELWLRSLDPGANDSPFGLVLDAADSVYVTGVRSQLITTFKYDADGVEQWVMTLDSSAFPDGGAGIALDSEGQVVVAGAYPIVTVRYGQPACPWDLDGSRAVGTADLLALLSAWGSDPGGPPDFDASGAVDTADLLMLLAAWGACP